jgi:hydroxyacylglutathione hydrolase
MRYAPAAADYLVEDRRDLTFLGFNAFILSTPGHTAGSMSVIVDNEVALVGDAMFGVFRGSILPPFGFDLNEMVESWGRLIGAGCTIFLPGHGTFRDKEVAQKAYERRRKKIL